MVARVRFGDVSLLGMLFNPTRRGPTNPRPFLGPPPSARYVPARWLGILLRCGSSRRPCSASLRRALVARPCRSRARTPKAQTSSPAKRATRAKRSRGRHLDAPWRARGSAPRVRPVPAPRGGATRAGCRRLRNPSRRRPTPGRIRAPAGAAAEAARAAAASASAAEGRGKTITSAARHRGGAQVRGRRGPSRRKIVNGLLEGIGKCVAEHGGLKGAKGKLELTFLVRARGRAEGVEIDNAKGISEEAASCVRLLVKNRAVGAPSADPVGVKATFSFERPKP